MVALPDERRIVLYDDDSGRRQLSLKGTRSQQRGKKFLKTSLTPVPDLRLFTPLPEGARFVGGAVEDIAEALTKRSGRANLRLHSPWAPM